eukprot:TRINITY_DN7103_c0_g1_i1.p1 TRINITY_DN7103_c0_g1~~TRINITY_DN7103_c0_g1_i1.p1  ORF type:complete len:431 (-),score=56.67 TRINITY_DN7103_c0_g1_i1:403-1695(-)
MDSIARQSSCTRMSHAASDQVLRKDKVEGATCRASYPSSSRAELLLPAHEVCIVNTFVEFKERKPQVQFSKSHTAPASSLHCESDIDDNDDDSEGPEADISSAKTNAAQAAETPNSQGTADESNIEDTQEELGEDKPACEQTDSGTQKIKPSLSHMDTAELWGVHPHVESVQPQTESKNVVKCQRFRHMDTAELWHEHPQVSATSNASLQSMTMPAATYIPVQPMPMAPVLFPAAVPILPAPAASPTHPCLLGRISAHASQATEQKTLPCDLSRRVETHVRPGMLEYSRSADGVEQVSWHADGQKLDSHSEKLLSPEFKLALPGQEPQTFRLMILATQTGGKHGAGFKKARGRGLIELKCLGDVSPNTSNVGLRMSVGSGTRARSCEDVIWHSFSEKNCCAMQKAGEDWDLLSAVSKDSKCAEIRIEVRI